MLPLKTSALWLLGALLSTARSAPLDQKVLSTATDDKGSPLPLVIWHGLGDNYEADGLHSVGDLAKEVNPGTYVYYIRLDDDASADKSATFLGNLNEQVAKVCADLATEPILSTAPAINGIGFSQGGQFLRAYVERCNNPPVSSLVTFGAQHNGIAEFQNCSPDDWLCNGWEGILKTQTWSDWVQKKLVPAQYYRDPEDLDNFLEHSNFLADINNERAEKNQTYVDNIKKLEHFAMWIFEDDTTVVPKWSGWFNEYNTTSGKQTRLQDRQLYLEDWLGLRWLDEHNRLDTGMIDGEHMHLTDEVLRYVFKRYFSKRVDVGQDTIDEIGQVAEL